MALLHSLSVRVCMTGALYQINGCAPHASLVLNSGEGIISPAAMTLVRSPLKGKTLVRLPIPEAKCANTERKEPKVAIQRRKFDQSFLPSNMNVSRCNFSRSKPQVLSQFFSHLFSSLLPTMCPFSFAFFQLEPSLGMVTDHGGIAF